MENAKSSPMARMAEAAQSGRTGNGNEGAFAVGGRVAGSAGSAAAVQEFVASREGELLEEQDRLEWEAGDEWFSDGMADELEWATLLVVDFRDSFPAGSSARSTADAGRPIMTYTSDADLLQRASLPMSQIHCRACWQAMSSSAARAAETSIRFASAVPPRNCWFSSSSRSRH